MFNDLFLQQNKTEKHSTDQHITEVTDHYCTQIIHLESGVMLPSNASLSANVSNFHGGGMWDNRQYSLLYMGRAYNNVTRRVGKPNQGMRRSTTSSALALLAFLFFLNVLQRSLDDNKQGPIVMTRTTTMRAIILRNDLTENKFNKPVITTNRDNIHVTKYENIFNKYLR